MRKLPLAFFTTAAVFALCGMAWGIKMAASENFTTAPAHAHLNLVGWTSLALMGAFYALSGQGGRLGWINYALSAGAVIVMIPSLAMMLSGNPGMMPLVAAGSVLAALGMVTFLVSLVIAWRAAAT